MRRLNKQDVVNFFERIGVKSGDTVLIRANLGAIGGIVGGADGFLDALLEAVGKGGTIVSLAFTQGGFIFSPNKDDVFHIKKKSYAGSLPNKMIDRTDALRSNHPMCSFIAIGRHANEITSGHNENSAAYEPIRKIINLGGKNLLIGCVESSPGFTTAHLAEYDLGMSKLAIFSRLVKAYYLDKNNNYAIFHRKDPGLCSNSYYKFYAHYVKCGVLNTGSLGDAYAILAPAKDCYEIEKKVLSKNRKFNLCDSADCFTCNVNRWDRVHRIPSFMVNLMIKKIKNLLRFK